MLAKGWTSHRFRRAATAGSNGDIWELIGEELTKRGGAEGWREIQVMHLNSHLSAEEAQLKGVPRHAWEGNRIVDQLAEAAAEKHAIPDTEMACYEWARATGQLVRARIAAATLHGLEDNPREEREVKEQRAAERRAAKEARSTKAKVLAPIAPPPTPHELQRVPKGTGWRCRCCKTQVTNKDNLPTIMDWLSSCSGAPPNAHRLQLSGAWSHHTHALRWSEEEQLWFCTKCNSEAKDRLSKNMKEECAGRPPIAIRGSSPPSAHQKMPRRTEDDTKGQTSEAQATDYEGGAGGGEG